MVACVGSRIWWSWRVEDAFERMEQGEKNALRHEASVQRQQVIRSCHRCNALGKESARCTKC